MNLFAKVAIATAIGAACWAASTALPQIPTIALFVVAALASALLPGGNAAATGSDGREAAAPASTGASGPREQGSVKWFNGTKGFGFITKDNGDEIFVHFRSIRGGDRRSLKDGQRVNFVEAQTDKGPQAEDVVAE